MKKLLEAYVKMQSMLQDKKGATMVEYALIVALIAVVAVGAVDSLGDKVDATFDSIVAKM